MQRTHVPLGLPLGALPHSSSVNYASYRSQSAHRLPPLPRPSALQLGQASTQHSSGIGRGPAQRGPGYLDRLRLSDAAAAPSARCRASASIGECARSPTAGGYASSVCR